MKKKFINLSGLLLAICSMLACSSAMADAHDAVLIFNCTTLTPGNGTLEVFQAPGRGVIGINIFIGAAKNHNPDFTSVQDVGDHFKVNFASVQNGNLLLPAQLTLPKSLTVTGGRGTVLVSGFVESEDGITGIFSRTSYQGTAKCVALAAPQL